MHEFGTSPEAFAGIGVKSRHHASLNPNARFRDTITLMRCSRRGRSPIRLRSISAAATARGAAALVLASEKRCNERAGPQGLDRGVRAGLRHGRQGAARPHELGATRTPSVRLRSCRHRCRGHRHRRVARCIHNWRTAALRGSRPLPQGDGQRLVADGDTTRAARVPVNVSGGLLSKSHPLGAPAWRNSANWSGSCVVRPRAGRSKAPGPRSPTARAAPGSRRAPPALPSCRADDGPERAEMTATTPSGIGITRLLDYPLARCPDKTAYIDDRGEITFAELELQAARLAAAFARSGAKPGDRAAVILPNCIPFIVAETAILRSGLVKVPLNIRFHPKEVLYFASRLRAHGPGVRCRVRRGGGRKPLRSSVLESDLRGRRRTGRLPVL